MDVERQIEALAARRWRVAIVLTGAMMVTYFAFLMLVAYDKPLLGAVVTPGLSWGILIGALVIVFAWVITGIYVRWANRNYDAAIAALKKQAEAE